MVCQLKARPTTNHVLTKGARSEFNARGKVRQTELRHVRSHSGNPGNELADVFADLGCIGELSHVELLAWLGALRLPAVAERPRLQLHSLIFWANVLEADDPVLAPNMPLSRPEEERPFP